MIEKGEIDHKSIELGVNVASVQRDYVFGWLLCGLFQPQNPLAQHLILKGGNSFRKGYFEFARYSNDLDFSVKSALDLHSLELGVKEACEYAKSRSGVEFLIDQNRYDLKKSHSQETKCYEVRVYFKSFYDEGDITIRVQLDVKEFDLIILPIQSRNLIHSYSDSEACRCPIQCLKLEELLAQKLIALLQRRHSPDLFDFVYSVFFQKSLSISRLEVISTFLKRSIYEPNPEVARNLLLELPFAMIEGFWKEYLVLPKISSIEFSEAQERFCNGIGDFFALLTTQHGYRRAGAIISHFPANLRNMIMEAALSHRVLRLVYEGVPREIEPYALSFKRRQDGIAREYLYGWDQSGGTSGQIGIKSYTADKANSLSITERTFEPRYEIELKKGGSYFGKGSFSRGSESFASRTSKRPSRPTGLAMQYTVQCPYCQKQFKRKRFNDTQLNEHKDRFGNKCYGKRGYLV